MPILTKKDGERNHTYEFTDDDMTIVEEMAALGLCISDIAAALTISDKQLYHILRKEQKEAESFKGKGKWKVAYLDQNLWARFNKGLNRHKMIITKGLTEHAIKGNPQVLMFLARTKLGWNDKIVQEDQNQLNAEILSEITIDFVEAEELPEPKQ